MVLTLSSVVFGKLHLFHYYLIFYEFLKFFLQIDCLSTNFITAAILHTIV